MYVCQLTFQCQQELALDTAQQAIGRLLEEYRYNGQIIGREFPVIWMGDHFEVVFVCPEQDSLAQQYTNEKVDEAFEALLALGLSVPSFEVKGLESQSDFVDVCETPNAYVLYSTFVQSCSPIRCFDHFAPVPIYKVPAKIRKSLVKWQESYAACDQLQMNEMTEVESHVVAQLSEPNSQLMLKGRELADEIQTATDAPVYLYIYRVGGESLESEKKRKCPSCGGDWVLSEALFGLFDFRCDNCQLLSNISWDWQ